MLERDGLETPVRVLIGSEVSLDAPDLPSARPEVMATWDYVIISANHFHLPCVQQPRHRTEEAYADFFLTMAEAAIGFGASIIPHPFSYIGVRTMEDGREIDWPRLMKAYDKTRIRKVFRMAADRGTAFELNPGRIGKDRDFFSEIIRIGRDEGMKFSIGSDGHHPGQMHFGGAEQIAEFEQLFRSLGVIETDICAEYAPRISRG
jgi:histidinol phosphatase-like PHP family hydrolase